MRTAQRKRVGAGIAFRRNRLPSTRVDNPNSLLLSICRLGRSVCGVLYHNALVAHDLLSTKNFHYTKEKADTGQAEGKGIPKYPGGRALPRPQPSNAGRSVEGGLKSKKSYPFA